MASDITRDTSANEGDSMEKHLRCSICMETFTDPVTTPCGHSFCYRCLHCCFELHDRVCPLCKAFIHRIPEVNIILRGVVQHLTEAFTGAAGEVACDVCVGRPLKAEKSCLVCLTSYCALHLGGHASNARFKGHKLVEPVADLDERACLRHGRPLELYNRTQQRCVCVLCGKEGEDEVVSAEDEWDKKKVEIGHFKAELQQQIEKRKKSEEEMNTSLTSCKKALESEWREVEEVFAAMAAVVAAAQTDALHPLRERRRVLEEHADELRHTLKTEIQRLQKSVSQLEELSQYHDHVLFLQRYPSLPESHDLTDWTDVKLDTSLTFGTMRKTTTAIMEGIQRELEKLTSIELKRVPNFAVDIRFDGSTAHPRLLLSDDGKEVKDGGEDQEVDDGPERFDVHSSVLGLSALTSGRSYWEVEVRNKSGWDVGVARGDVDRKGKLTLNPDHGFWVMVHYEANKYAALTVPPTQLVLPEPPKKVGVFVDYQEGLVSFYDVAAQSHIYSFTNCSFGDKLLPYFSPHLRNEKNTEPLILS